MSDPNGPPIGAGATLNVIHPRGGEPAGSMVETRAPPPGAPVSAGTPMTRPAPPAGVPGQPGRVIAAAAETPAYEARLALLEGRMAALEARPLEAARVASAQPFHLPPAQGEGAAEP